MGRDTFTRSSYNAAAEAYVPRSGPATRVAEQRAHRTGKLDELVDPAGIGVIRRSLLRFEEQPNGLLELTIGCSMPVETRVDTTGSMGRNVDVAIKVLPDSYNLCSSVLPGYDLHMATGIFGDVVDRFVLCRPQFEMLAEKIVEQLTLMVPERAGGDAPEDPHYGLFGGAYLVAAYANRIGLKGYDFTISDEPARYGLSERELVRIYGPDVFDKVAANGHTIDRNNLPSTEEVVQDLLKRAHAFFLEVETGHRTTHPFWTEVFGSDRVIVLPRIELLPQVQAIIIGLTEGTLSLSDVLGFLIEAKVTKEEAKFIENSVANIPIGAQEALRAGIRVPQKGDLYRDKTDLWPIDSSEIPAVAATAPTATSDEPHWL